MSDKPTNLLAVIAHRQAIATAKLVADGHRLDAALLESEQRLGPEAAAAIATARAAMYALTEAQREAATAWAALADHQERHPL